MAEKVGLGAMERSVVWERAKWRLKTAACDGGCWTFRSVCENGARKPSALRRRVRVGVFRGVYKNDDKLRRNCVRYPKQHKNGE